MHIEVYNIYVVGILEGLELDIVDVEAKKISI